MSTPFDRSARETVAEAAGSLLAGCRPIAKALRETKSLARTKVLKGQIDQWIAVLEAAVRQQSILDRFTETEIRISADVADVFRGAAVYFTGKRPRLPRLIVPILMLLVIVSVYFRLRAQIEIGESEHDREAARLMLGMLAWMETGQRLDDIIIPVQVRQRSMNNIAAWLENSLEEYDRRLAPTVRFLAATLCDN
jgi:hypothetical protein